MSISIALNFLKNKPSVGFFAAIIPVTVVDWLLKLTPVLYVGSLAVGVLIGLVTAILKALELEEKIRNRIKARKRNASQKNTGNISGNSPN